MTIDDAWRGALPPDGAVRIVERHGYDIAPIDVTGADGELTVLSYVWPDQPRAAGPAARRHRGRPERPGASGAPRRRPTRSPACAVADGALTVLWHSITWQYLSADERDAVRGAVEALAARADARSPFAHLTLEPARAGPGAPIRFLVRARSWPGGELTVLGECHPHGPPVKWH